jgi:hypothetical protein
MADGAVFILPVCIDATTEAEAVAPEKFKAVHFARLEGGAPSRDFVQRIRDLTNAKSA